MENVNDYILSDKYHLIRRLGQGSSSNVYLAEHMKLKTYRAIKVISKTHPLQSQFRLEANLLKSLSHPAIPVVYDIDEDDTFLYIIEEYVEGESLQDYLLYHDNISQEYIMQLGIRLCEVLTYLHTRRPNPVFYQDLKPEHIIVYGNSVKIVDFGIASYITIQGKKIQQYGTRGYAAPEQYLGEKLCPATDLYALGKVLAELQNKIGKNCSKNFDRLLRKAVREDAGERFTSALEMQRELEKEFERISPGEKQTHLKYQIAVAGAKPGIGTTHIAAALTSFLNSQKISCMYQSMVQPDIVQALIRGNSKASESGDIYVKGSFKAKILSMEEAAEAVMEDEIIYGAESYVRDFGSDIAGCKAENAEYTILIVGGNEWETECSVKAFEMLKHTEKLIVICNYNHKQICKKYAAMFQTNVYCFPFDENPFAVTREKKNLFRKLLQAERRS